MWKPRPERSGSLWGKKHARAGWCSNTSKNCLDIVNHRWRELIQQNFTFISDQKLWNVNNTQPPCTFNVTHQSSGQALPLVKGAVWKISSLFLVAGERIATAPSLLCLFTHEFTVDLHYLLLLLLKSNSIVHQIILISVFALTLGNSRDVLATCSTMNDTL